MAGPTPVGESLTPNRNVFAPAGYGGDVWGAYGGGVVAIGIGKPAAATLSNGETAINGQQSPIPLTVAGAPAAAVGTQASRGVLSLQTLDSSLAQAGSLQG